MTAGVLSKKALRGLKPEVFILAAELVSSKEYCEYRKSHYSCVAIHSATGILGIHPNSRHRYAEEYGRVFQNGRSVFDKARGGTPDTLQTTNGNVEMPYL